MAQPNIVKWAQNSVIDPTTGQPNRRATGLTSSEELNGFIPAGVRPSRQGINTVLYELAQWTNYLSSEYFPLDRAYNDYAQGFRKGLFINTGGLYSNSNDLWINQFKIGAMLVNPSDSSDVIPYFPTTGASLISKDNEVAWSEGNGGGLKAYAGTPSNIFVYLFIIGVKSGTGGFSKIDFATDTDINGSNITGGTIFTLFGYTHIKRIATLPYIDNGGRKFADFVYQYDDYIMYGEEQTNGSRSSSTSSSSYVDTTLQMVTTVTNALPPGDCEAILFVRGDSISLDISIIADKWAGITVDTAGSLIRLQANDNYSVINKINAEDSQIRHKSLSAVNTIINYVVLGYKNPDISA